MANGFTAEEIEAEHRRRQAMNRPADPTPPRQESGGGCVHCGMPIGFGASAADVGLCDNCLYAD